MLHTYLTQPSSRPPVSHAECANGSLHTLCYAALGVLRCALCAPQVVRVSDWASLTPDRLEGEYRAIQEGVARGVISWTKVFLPYWLHRHTAHINPLLQI